MEETFAINVSYAPLLTNGVVDQNVAVLLKYPAMYVFPPLSTATQYAESKPIPPHFFARKYSPEADIFVMKISYKPLLTNGVVDQSVIVLIKYPTT